MENPVGYLNEKFQPPYRPQYRIVSGPPENPNFSIELSLKGRNFYGEGKSKKEAKKSSAQKAVDELIQSRMEQKVIEFEKVQDTITMEKKEKPSVATISETNKINHMSKEFIREQPLIQFTGAIHLIYTYEESRKAIKHLYEKNNMSEFVVGVDTETKPTFEKGQKRHHPSWIQVADDSIAYLFYIGDKNGMKNVIEPIVELLSDEKVTKVGAGLTSDIKNLNIAYTELCQKHMLKSKNVLNLDQIAREKGIKQGGLVSLAVRYLGGRISKSQQTSDWGKRKLTNGQKKYAATDAWISFKVFAPLSKDKTDWCKIE